MLLLGADPLTRFLNNAAGRTFRWGEFDCLLWLADWIQERTGDDPAADLRGTYKTMLGAARIVADAGGMVRLVDRRLTSFTSVRASVPQRGAIAVVSIPGRGGEHFGSLAGAILLDGTAALVSQEGLVLPRWGDAPVIAAWTV